MPNAKSGREGNARVTFRTKYSAISEKSFGWGTNLLLKGSEAVEGL